MKAKFLHYLSLVFVLQALWLPVQSQGLTATGKVTSGLTGEPLEGATISVKGASVMTTNNASGIFIIAIPQKGATLVISYQGMRTQELAVPSSGTLNVQLDPSANATMSEVVVVGYGVQKKSVVTGAISSVKATQLENMPINRIEQALQGRVSGVTIAINNGQPGSGATVRVRGITTLNNNDPLWIVDGVVVDNNGIGYLNQSDIESIEVLKDAASAAIYGARAAAGVILITTKKGKSGAIRVNYNAFYGVSQPARKLDLLNATEYATLRNESSVAAGKSAPFADPASYGVGTDWQDLIFNQSARRQNHEFSISGGNDRSTFYASFGLLDQQGIVASDISNFKRVNIRLNSTHKIGKHILFGQNLGYAYDKSIGLGNTNSEFGGPLSSAINLDPITASVITDPAIAATYHPNAVKDAYGNPYGISVPVGQEMTNPLAYIKTHLGNFSWADNFIGNVYTEIEVIKGLKIRSTLGGKLSIWGGDSFSPVAYLNPSNNTVENNFTRSFNRNLGWNLENTISYTKEIGNHNITLLGGQGSYNDGSSRNNSVTYFGIPATTFDQASMNYSVPNTKKNAGSGEGQDHKVNSLFARINYNYAERYLVQALVRRDGSSRFGDNNKFGYFPSFSFGWVATREDFFPQTDYVDFLKVRGGYGVVGNENLGNFQYVSVIGGGRNYAFGQGGNYETGNSPNSPANPDLKWEETRQTNIGFDATVLKNFTITFDYFKKKTVGILMSKRIPGYVGAVSDPTANIADMENSGFEIEVGYRKKLGQVNLSMNGNVSHFSNKVTNLGPQITYTTLNQQTFHTSAYPLTRTELNQPVNYFYGFQTAGVFQSQADIDNYVAKNGNRIQPNAVPGDFKWADINGDGKISDSDRVKLGSALPSVTYGFTINVDYKAFDLVFFAQGAAGNKIYQGLRRLDILTANYSSKMLGRWTGAGTSNDIARLSDNDPNRNYTIPSNFFLEDGSYFRIKTLQLGYSLPESMIKRIGLNKARFYVMGENLLTFTKYSGFDPEIGGGFGAGIDRGIYPQARSYMFGVNLGF